MFESFFFFFQAEDGIRDVAVTGVQTCALPISVHGQVVNRVEGRVELAEQAALGHAPPAGEIGCRDAVELWPHATRPATSAAIPTSIAPLSRRLLPWVRPVNNRLATASTTSWANRAIRKYAPW